MIKKIQEQLKESSKIKLSCLDLANHIESVAQQIIKVFKRGNKVLLVGNGGSAADAQHIAAELVNKFNLDREPLPALALHTNTSNLTSISNDYGFDYIFAKQIKALGQKGDILIIITTSDAEDKQGGHSTNLLRALEEAKKKDITVIGLLSEKSKELEKLVDYALKVPAQSTARIQEAHITIMHVICDLVEEVLFNEK